MNDAPTAAAADWRRAIATAHDFVGAKLALFIGSELLIYRRDRKPGIPHPGCWDLAGGGREGDETPFACAARELIEEFALRIEPAHVVWARAYPSVTVPSSRAWFLAGRLPAAASSAIRFGDEGEEWRLAEPGIFLGDDEAVPYLKDRLGDYIEAEGKGLAGVNAV
ncbi:NUDIX hydrolase [Aureimonas leprariae]|uniref:NUDIX domain-containing protein n=1 Tax=Plantimonas leprariae TaxID=2615207 RepID=A0A7V7PPY1_9HYPH|nr:NUDIX hydrolase [Aureimonas leprariae]KAB0680131.1 NUDIX domain-containing protein [Aureimonas leprariae]